jgi:hypothetical protein
LWSRPVPKSFLGNGTPRCPGLVGWTDMWWLPLGPCSTQPSASNRLINARATRRRGHTHWSSVLDWSGVVVVARSRAPCITWKQTRPATSPCGRLRVQQPVPAGWLPRMESLDRTRKDYRPGPYPRQRLRRTVPGPPPGGWNYLAMGHRPGSADPWRPIQTKLTGTTSPVPELWPCADHPWKRNPDKKERGRFPDPPPRHVR